MQQLESQIGPLVSAAESQPIRSALPMSTYPTEDIVTKALRGICRIKLNRLVTRRIWIYISKNICSNNHHSARIKVHRYCAFLDMPIFSQRHCDLKSTTQPETQRQPQLNGTSCCQDSLRDLVDRRPENISRPQPPLFQAPAVKPPFTTNFSANICRISALSIAHSFSSLPLPNPSGSIDLPSPYLTSFPNPKSPTSNPANYTPISQTFTTPIPAPRTMPSFACCAMQSAYAMLMLCYKAHAIPLPPTVPETGNSFAFPTPAESGIELLVRSYVDQLTQGLRLVLGALENYSTAFEAVDGMRDQIGEALTAAAASFEGDGMDGVVDEGVQAVEWQGSGGADGNGIGASGWSS